MTARYRCVDCEHFEPLGMECKNPNLINVVDGQPFPAFEMRYGAPSGFGGAPTIIRDTTEGEVNVSIPLCGLSAIYYEPRRPAASAVLYLKADGSMSSEP